jgi:methionyl-tRNA formyltransferase
MRIVFMGTPQAAVPTLKRILDDGHEVTAVYTQPDRPSGRGKKIVFSPVKQFAIEQGIPVFQPEKIRTEEALNTFRGLGADAAIVVAYGRILPATFLSAFPLGAINVHFSLLPKYRGAAPVNWAIVNGEITTGVTTMKMDEGLDTGDILLQSETEIGNEETSLELMPRLAEMGAELLGETLGRFHDIIPVSQNHELATLAPILKKEDGNLDWSQDAVSIERRVRGFQPFPATYTFLNDIRMTLWKSRADVGTSNEVPGTVVRASGGELIVACGNGECLVIMELQLEGKKRMTVKDYLNGSAIRVGTLLT